jgi:hypothetical protein
MPTMDNVSQILTVNGEASGYMAHRYDDHESPSTHRETNARGYALYAYAVILVTINGLIYE